jgi:hypothetical protein
MHDIGMMAFGDDESSSHIWKRSRHLTPFPRSMPDSAPCSCLLCAETKAKADPRTDHHVATEQLFDEPEKFTTFSTPVMMTGSQVPKRESPSIVCSRSCHPSLVPLSLHFEIFYFFYFYFYFFYNFSFFLSFFFAFLILITSQAASR